MGRALLAEGLGTMFLLAIVVGSGIMGEQLAGGNVALALLANSLATGLGLAVLIFLFAPLSGAHFNPAVTLVFCLQGAMPWRRAPAYIGIQIAAGIIGVWLAHGMFAEPWLQLSTTQRPGGALMLSEIVATFGLILTIIAGVRQHPAAVPWLVGAYIAAAYWFTASTSFANPAVTIARSLSDTFAGIAPSNVAAFVLMQLVGAILACGACHYLYPPRPVVAMTASEDAA